MPGVFKMAQAVCARCSREYTTRAASLREGQKYCSLSCSKKTGRKARPRKGRRPKLGGTWYSRNKDLPGVREALREGCRRYRQTPRGRTSHCAREARRRAAKLHATPPWADLEKIREIYLNCPKGMHVDHIVPLQGKTVCGLHVHYNLQYLTGSENCRKNNKLIPPLQDERRHQES